MSPSTIRSFLLIVLVVSAGVGLGAWKYASLQAGAAAAAAQPEPMESITVVAAREIEHRETATSIGTVLAIRSISLRNELPGTVREVTFAPGQIVDAGAVLVALDVSVEEAELKAQEAQATLAKAMLVRRQLLRQDLATAQEEVDRARADLDVALAQIARIKAVIARKTIRAPFRGRVGIADVHPGQYLGEGTQLTTLQGIDDALHVDFTVAQQVAARLKDGDAVEVFTPGRAEPIEARIVAVDARIDPATRNALVRARIARTAGAPSPGASVRVRVPVSDPHNAVAVPLSALRKGPGGDQVFVVAPDGQGKLRAAARQVESGGMLGDEVVIRAGLSAGERVAASGSFKLRDGVLLVVAGEPQGEAQPGPATSQG